MVGITLPIGFLQGQIRLLPAEIGGRSIAGPLVVGDSISLQTSLLSEERDSADEEEVAPDRSRRLSTWRWNPSAGKPTKPTMSGMKMTGQEAHLPGDGIPLLGKPIHLQVRELHLLRPHINRFGKEFRIVGKQIDYRTLDGQVDDHSFL